MTILCIATPRSVCCLAIAILYLLFVIVVIFCSLSSKSGCGGISHDQRVQGGTGVDVDPTENGIPPHLPLWVQVPPARNTLHRGGSEQHHAEADPPGLLSIIEAIKPPGSNWTPKPLRTRVDD